jgi:2-methylisocitrate lyase-like PEP mutase family enzyme
MHPGSKLKTALAGRSLVTAPGVFDMISARIADGLGFQALYMTGYGVSASHLGLPDAGLASYTEMLSRVAQICQGTTTPVICDADTGFGGLLNVERTVKGYEAAGAAAIQIEDQVFPKRCGHTPGRRVGEAYAKAGADMLFIESPESEEEMAQIGRRFAVPLLANMADGGRTPILPRERLEALGYKIAIFPATGFLATAKALERVYGVLRETGSSDTLAPELYPFDKFCRMIGFERVWEFEKRWPET